MKLRHLQRSGDEKIELQMTPMIDIVFQLLIFFILTFKIAPMEGDFRIKMPLAAPAVTEIDLAQLPPLKVRLRATDTGQLAAVQFGDNVLTGTPQEAFEKLHSRIRDIVGDESGPGSVAESTEVELDCDYNLRFEYVIDAISALSGYVVDEGDRTSVVRLIEKIKFAPRRPPE